MSGAGFGAPSTGQPNPTLSGGSLPQGLQDSLSQPPSSSLAAGFSLGQGPQVGPSLQPSPQSLGTPLTEVPLSNAPVQDGFREQFRATPELAAALQGQPVETPVSTLVASLDNTKTLADVESRFATDFPLLRSQVEDLPHLTDAQKAGRTFEFFEEYASRFVALANGEAHQAHAGEGDASVLDLPNGAGELPHEELVPRDPLLKKLVPGTPAGNGPLVEDPSGDAGETLALLKGMLGDPRAVGDGKSSVPKEGLSKLDRLLLGDSPKEVPAGKDGKAKEAQKEPGADGRLARLLAGEGGADAALLESLAEHRDGANLKQPKPGEAEIQQRAKSFSQLLESFDFDKIHDQTSGKNGVELAHEMLKARSSEDFEKLAQRKELTAEQWPPRSQDDADVPVPAEQYHPGTLGKDPARMKDLGESRPELDRRFESERLTHQVERSRIQASTEINRLILSPLERERRDTRMSDYSDLRDTFGRMGRKLGSNQLWNVLHQFRSTGADSAVEKEKFDQLAFGAICLLALLSLGVIALACL
jgi:hypothetical protein